MNDTELRAAVLAALGDIAPEADLDALADDVDVREELDLDSMDFLNVVTAIAESTGVEIPEADYQQVVTVAGCVRYLADRGT